MSLNNWFDLDFTPANNGDLLGQSTAGTNPVNTVDNMIRALAALIARSVYDLGGDVTVGGSADAITITSNSTYQDFANGLLIAFKAGASNTGATTLNLDTLGIKKVRKQGDAALSAGDILSGGTYLLKYDDAYDTAAGAWVLLNPTVAASTDIGTVIAGLAAKAAPITADLIGISDSADSNAGKKATIAQVLGALITTLRGLSVVTGDILYGSGASTLSRLAKGTDGQILTLASGLPSWASPSAGTGVGISQTWDDGLTRTEGTSYQNTTGKPIMVAVNVLGSSGGPSVVYFQISTNGSAWEDVAIGVASSATSSAAAIIPNGHYYRVPSSASYSITSWAELR